jgi:ribosomal protein L25 (general stress protein Ctc)
MTESDGSGEVELVRVSGKIAAESILAALRANGIPARAHGEAAGELYGLTLDGMGEVTIFVRASQLDSARELLKAADLGQLRLGDDLPGNGEQRGPKA